MTVPTLLVSPLAQPFQLYKVRQLIHWTGDYIPFGYFSDLEFNIGIACICMPSVRVVLRRYFPSCGLATTDHSASGHDPEMAIRRVNFPSESKSKSLRSFSRHVTGDASSDQVELCEYNTPSEPKQTWLNISSTELIRPGPR